MITKTWGILLFPDMATTKSEEFVSVAKFTPSTLSELSVQFSKMFGRRFFESEQEDLQATGKGTSDLGSDIQNG